MNDKELKYYQKRLEELRSENEGVAKNISEGLRKPLMDSIGELSLYDNHPGDVGDSTFEREKDLGLKILTEEQLAMIDEALEAIKDGKYGICKTCGEQISQARLEAIPFAALCRNCKERIEDGKRQARPIEEEVIIPPFGGLEIHKEYLDKQEGNNAFDGEDAWQAVARYGTSNSPSDIGSIDDYGDVYVNSDEAIGTVEKYEAIASHKEKDGQLYKDFLGENDEDTPFNWAND
jgi:YteA family regulatory protein